MKSGYGSIGAVGETVDLLPRDDESTDVVRRETASLIPSRPSWKVGMVVTTFLALVVWSSTLPKNTTTARENDDIPLLGKSRSSHHHKHHYKKHFLLKEKYDEKELFFDDQYLDHIGQDTEHHTSKLQTYSQRYYKKSKYWKGPGHPILMILGGEDSLDLPMLYPYVNKGIAKEFHAFVVSPEHRFYGKSQPIIDPTDDELVKYLTPDQALADAINLLQMLREELGCSNDPTSKKYCPVITFGGSYPGFLSTMMRFRFPDYVDIAYASSAPLELYSQLVDANAYYDKVTEVADKASSGCSSAVHSTLVAVRDEILANYTSVVEAAGAVGFCEKHFPKYMKDIPEFISETITYLVPAIFADFNMAYYPPGPTTALARACSVFQQSDKTPMERMSNFFDLRGEVEYGLDHKPKCFDLSLELPSGPNARIRGADNSGTGGGFTGEIWEFQCCKDLIIRAGYSEESMFLSRPFNYTWHTEHCHERFPSVPVEPYRMVNQWGFNDLSQTTNILFANGLNDGWSTSSILATDNPNLAVLNFPNGAHHSELGSVYPREDDTDDIVAGHAKAIVILGQWLNEIKSQQVADESRR